ncbi:MAG: acetylxylan esterase [Bacteroidales bacterium]|nr:acetylxylan esterase [Bacteroidales bacterium]
MVVLYIVLGLIGLVICYLTVVIFFPVLTVKEQPLNRITSGSKEIPNCRQDVEYSVNGEIIRSWLYLPDNTSAPIPGIILCNGFGGTKDAILEKYAMGFVNEGYVALALEYRHFGESDGLPRQHFSFRKQIEDIHASADFLRSIDTIDPARIVIWGTSAGGPHGLYIAAEDHSIAGVIAQCAGLDHKKDDKIVTRREGFSFILKLVVHAQRDKGRSRFGLSPHTVPIVGKPGTFALLNAPGAHAGYSSLIPEGSPFENRLCARVILIPPGVDPIKSSLKVRCPVLLCVCEKDELVAPDSYVRVAGNLQDKATVKKYPIGHFDIYKGEHFDKAFQDQVGFLKDIL